MVYLLSRSRRQLQIEDDLNHKVDLKKDDNVKNEDVLKNEGDLKNKDNLKTEDDLKNEDDTLLFGLRVKDFPLLSTMHLGKASNVPRKQKKVV